MLPIRDTEPLAVRCRDCGQYLHFTTVNRNETIIEILAEPHDCPPYTGEFDHDEI